MSWEMHEAAKKIADGWYSELEAARKRNAVLGRENAKLRELLGDVSRLLFALDVDHCACCPRDSNAHPCPVYTIAGGECLYKKDMRELGIEVDK